MSTNIVDKFIEVKISPESSFTMIIETLSRIGIPSKTKKSLTQSCHILQKRGKYYIVHFKELFLLDGKESSLTTEDVARRNRIAQLLEDWGLISIVNNVIDETEMADLSKIKIIPHSEKSEWTLVEKYTIGKKR